MGDAGPRMDVCPHCKKPFKRLKSHLPHCKMIGPPISADQKVYQPKPATLPHAKKESRPTKRKEPETESAKINAKSERGRPEWTAATSPLPGGVLERAGTTEAGREAGDQNQQPSFQALRHAKIKVVLQRGTVPQSREPARDVTESKGSPRRPPETRASLLVGSMVPVLSHEGAASGSVGLEWFPELYPGYVGLGVLPRGPQHWNSMAQMPLPATSQGVSVSKGTEHRDRQLFVLKPGLQKESHDLQGRHSLEEEKKRKKSDGKGYKG